MMTIIMGYLHYSRSKKTSNDTNLQVDDAQFINNNGWKALMMIIISVIFLRMIISYFIIRDI